MKNEIAALQLFIDLMYGKFVFNSNEEIENILLDMILFNMNNNNNKWNNILNDKILTYSYKLFENVINKRIVNGITLNELQFSKLNLLSQFSQLIYDFSTNKIGTFLSYLNINEKLIKFTNSYKFKISLNDYKTKQKIYSTIYNHKNMFKFELPL